MFDEPKFSARTGKASGSCLVDARSSLIFLTMDDFKLFSMDIAAFTELLEYFMRILSSFELLATREAGGTDLKLFKEEA